MFDCHIHTKFSTDSNMTIEEVIAKSQALGLGAIITEHMDYNFPRSGEFVFDFEEYFNEYEKYRNDKLLLGIEMGMRPDCLEQNTHLSNSFNFDYIIGSIHFMNGRDLYEGGTYEGRTKKEAYEEYLESMLGCVTKHNYFDCLGHIDYISRYSTFGDKELYFNEFSDLIDEILKTLILKDKSIEINTRRFGEKIAIKSILAICRRYYELGGRNAVLGSDSHRAESIGANFRLAYEIAEASGLKLVYYKSRKINYL